MQKKAILTIYGIFSILGLSSAIFGVLVLVLPLTNGRAQVVVDFPQPKDAAQKPLTEKDKQAVFKALGEIIDQPLFKQAVVESGFDSIAKIVAETKGRVAGDWTEKIKIKPNPDASAVGVSVSDGSTVQKQEAAGAVAQVLAMRAPDYIGAGLITTKVQMPYVSYILPGWAIADLIVGGLFFFVAGLYGFASQKFGGLIGFISSRPCQVAEKKIENPEENKDPRYWLQKFLDENRN